MAWKRPTSIAYPSVWLKFTAKHENKLKHFRIQDATDDMIPMILEHMRQNYVLDEPICKVLKTDQDEQSMKDLAAFWATKVNNKIVIVCFEEDLDPRKMGKLIGCNILSVESNSFAEKPSTQATGNAASSFLKIFSFVLEEINIFKEFNVNHYLTAYGLSVDKNYRKIGVGAQLLKTRDKICKVLEIPLTVTAFTSKAGQNTARKAKFQTFRKIKYSHLENVLPDVHLPNLENSVIKLMYKKYNF